MPEPMPSFAEALLGARFSDDPVVLLITVMHPTGEVVRLVKNSEDVTSRGEVFKACWFDVSLINDDGGIPSSELTLPNVDNREIGQRYFRQITSPEITLEVIALSQPDEVITDARRLDLTGVSLQGGVSLTGRLSGKDHSSEPYGRITVIPSKFPALFRRSKKT